MSDPSDHPDPSRPPASDHELEVDIGAFLPEGSVLAGVGDDLDEHDAGAADVGDDDRGWGDDGDEPEVPAWARDDAEESPAHPDRAGTQPGGPTEPAQRAVGAEHTEGPADDPAPPAVDVAVLARIEEELAAVDEALEAVDAGDLGRSALLVALVGPDVARPSDG